MRLRDLSGRRSPRRQGLRLGAVSGPEQMTVIAARPERGRQRRLASVTDIASARARTRRITVTEVRHGGATLLMAPTDQLMRGRGALAGCHKLLWRMRRQLAPLAAIAGLRGLGTVAAHAHNGLRIMIVLGPLTAAGTWWLRYRRLDRAAERLYAACCLIGALGWMTAVAANGIGRPMPAVLWAGGAAVACPWWWHHRYRHGRTVPQADRVVVAWAEVSAPGGTLPGSSLDGPVPVPGGTEYAIRLVRGRQSTRDAVAAREKIASALSLPPGRVIVEPHLDEHGDHGDASAARLLVLDRASPQREVQLWQGPGLDPASGLFPAGFYPDSEPAWCRLFRTEDTRPSRASNSLVSGTTGSGKSRFMELKAAEHLRSGLFVIWYIDGQEGQSSPGLVEEADWAATSRDEALRLLKASWRVMRARSRYLARARWTDARGNPRRGHKDFPASSGFPFIQVVIDEAQEILKDARAVRLIKDLMRKGNKNGIGVDLVTHVPLLSELGAASGDGGAEVIRDMARSGNAIVFRTGSAFAGRVTLGPGMEVDPQSLPAEPPGMCYMAGHSLRPAPVRTWYLEDPYEHLAGNERPDLDELSARAAGEDYATRNARLGELDAAADFGAGLEFLDAELATELGESPVATQPIRSTGAERLSCIQTVLAILGEASGDMSLEEIISSTARHGRQYSKSAVYQALKALNENGKVNQPRHGHYLRVTPPAPHVAPDSDAACHPSLRLVTPEEDAPG